MAKTPTLLILKSTIPEGARWITIHANGNKDAKGQPVLIQPQADGSAKVIGGAGGALNHLRIRAVRSESEYKAEAEKRRAEKREQAKAQRAEDKERGLLEAKQAARKAVKDQRVKAEQEFVRTVADAMGWKQEDLRFDAEAHAGLSDAALTAAAAKHHRELLKRANAAVEQQRQRLVDDAAARAQADIGEVPLTAKDPATLTVEDLAPIPATDGGLGFAQKFEKRAEEAGLTDQERKAEVGAVQARREAVMTDAQRQAAIKRGEAAKLVKDEIKAIRDPQPESVRQDLVDAKKAVAMLKARKKLAEIQKQAAKASGEIDSSKVEPKAYVLEYTASPEDDEKVREQVMDDLRTASTVSFLSELHKMAGPDATETLGKHIGIGAYNSINSLALAVGGKALVDRSVVDVLGIAGAAQVLARRIHKDLPEDAQRIADGMQEFHLHHYMETSEKALAEARELSDAAREIELGEVANGTDLQAAQELNAKRRRAISDAQRILGQAAGEMEANAALVLALRQGVRDKPLQVSLGTINADAAVVRARALGLQRGEYTIEPVAGQMFLTVTPGGMDRLAQPVDRADIQQVQRNLDIINGRQDEEDWLPIGVARRPDLGLSVQPGVAPSLAKPFEPGDDVEKSLRDYIGGRAADGDPPADILADIQSADFFRKAGPGYQEILDRVAPLKDPAGKQRRAEDLADTFDGYADEYVQREYGGERSPLNRQAMKIDDVAVEALHRALSDHPEGVAAYKQIGELTPQDQRTLREVFYREIAKESPEAAGLRHDLEQADASEPERETEDMFGERMVNPEWTDWKARRDDLAAKVGQASLDWPKYADMMRGHEKAYETIQDLIRSKVSKAFADHHNQLRPGAPLKVGRAVIRGNLNHLDATDPAARDERLARERDLIDGLRERVGGRYAGGAVADKLDAARDQREAFEQAQMGFFSSEEAPPAAAGAEPVALAPDERHTLGHVAERQIAEMMGRVGGNFRPGQPVKLWQPTMSGGDNFARQRAIKMMVANKRMGLHLGAGSGKTLVSMGAFTDLHGRGQVKRGVFIVPSVVQGQFGGEALRYLQPGKYKWHCEPGASRDERIAGYKDSSNHFCVVTHQSFRDDMIHLGAQHAGISEKAMRDKLATMTRAERKAWASGVMQKEGINFDFSAVDEGHNLLDRQGKADSGMSMAIGGVTDSTTYHMSMTADPVRNNDASEVFSALQKIDPDRYSDRDAFLRRYGGDTVASKDALQREMARYFYAHSIQPKVNADRKEVTVPLAGNQKAALEDLDRSLAAMRLARMTGRVDVEAAKKVSPDSFADQPVAKHQEIAQGLQRAIGVVKEAAVQKIINEYPGAEKAAEVVRQIKARPGKPGIVFTRSLHAVEMLRQKLEAEGMRVVTISGSDSSEEKDRKRKMFSPDGDTPAQADVLVASDAASTGLNAQRGQWLIQYDTPQTAMTHAQRRARIHRVGQKNDVELIDLIGDHPSERRARDRLAKKYAMRDMMSSPLEKLDDTGLAYFLKKREAEAGQGGLF